MTNINITNARKELFNLVSSCLKFNDVINISTKDGNVVMISEDDYRSLTESLQMFAIPGMYEDIIDGACLPLDYCEKVEWK